jgi:hypothetical protein
MKVAKRPPDLSPPFQRWVMKHSKAAPRSGSMKRGGGPTPGPSELPPRRKHRRPVGQQPMLPLRGACSPHGYRPTFRIFANSPMAEAAPSREERAQWRCFGG